MIYDLSSPLDQRRICTRIRFLVKNGRTVELTERTGKRRTNPQNALFHTWVSVIADHCGYTDKEACKRDVKRTLLGMREEVNQLTGEVIQVDYRTSRMTADELSALMDKMKAWAQTDLGIYLPYYGDPGYEELELEYRNR